MPRRVVIVGGGAGGLELATKLGDRFGKKDRATVTLVDRSRTHLWKPLLHEVAAGSMDIHHNQLDYLAQARWHGFTFTLGPLTGLDRAARRIRIGRVSDDEGREILPERTIAYDMLVVAIGSESNDFGTPGVREHAFMLDNAWQAHLFHRRLVNACFHANFRAAGDVIHIVIVGGGATGVELSAELHNTIRLLAAYGLENFRPATQIKLTLVEAGPRILPGLPDHVAEGALQTLRDLGVDVMVKEKVVAATDAGIRTESGHEVKATFIVWAAGIKCSDVLRDLGGLESNRLNQLVVKPTLQTTRDDEVFAIGDCSAAPWRKDRTVPPRAQAAHQEASHIVETYARRLKGKPPREYRYRDFGSLVSLGKYGTVGQLMGFIGNEKFRVEGWVAKFFYISLYRQHVWALHGFWRMALDTLARMIRHQVEPKVKLH
ncbi:MAG TPA: NAD(P)/FAD-dependent oxidoreductase [Usitatibacter sp.]|nr:NAD(P)/FAD-dependent oxidoreductase [Usitatibacter sp.]